MTFGLVHHRTLQLAERASEKILYFLPFPHKTPNFNWQRGDWGDINPLNVCKVCMFEGIAHVTSICFRHLT